MRPSHPVPSADLDVQIERTLAGLSQAEPSPSFHNRLLTALDQHAAEPQRMRLSVFAFPAKVFAMTASAAALLMLLYSGVHLSRTHKTQTEAHAPAAQFAPPTAPGASSSAAVLSPVTVGPPSDTPTAANNTLPKTPKFHLSRSLELSPTSTPDLDQQALADLHAPSQPAPPLPPTSQERLVRLMLRRGEQHELAQLDPDSVTAAFAQEQASFRAFFEPSPDPSSVNQPRSLADAQAKFNTEGDTHQ